MNRKLKKILRDEYNKTVTNKPDFDLLATKLDLKRTDEKMPKPVKKNLFAKPYIFRYSALLSFVVFLVIGGTFLFNQIGLPKNNSPTSSENLSETASEVSEKNSTSSNDIPTGTSGTIEVEPGVAEVPFVTKSTLVDRYIISEDDALYSRDHVALINNGEEAASKLSIYQSEHQIEVLAIIDEIKTTEPLYFDTYSLIISPFIYSSSENPIIVSRIILEPEINHFIVQYELFSPLEYDTDVNIIIFVLEVIKDDCKLLDLSVATGSFIIHNTRDTSDSSVYYH